ncbi:MAG TPA: alpha/beta hydrolase-fold protein [Acidobacteriaceae bacterium]|jgi:S-formylglutathione hydrolase FrmB
MKLRGLFALCCLGLAAGCKSAPAPILEPDTPQLSADVKLLEDTIHSKITALDMGLRVIVPAKTPTDARLPVVYLLHGAGVNYHDWTTYSNIASFAAKGIVLVLPNMPGSYYINQLDSTNNRYEDFFMDELISEVHRLVPYTATDRAHTAIVGVSRGGYGAAVLGTKHPDVFGYVGLLSPAADFAERGFRLHAPWESLNLNRIFGPQRSKTRSENDPFLLIRTLKQQDSPYFFLACGDHDVLLGVTLLFEDKLGQAGLRSQFHLLRGSHNWGAWDQAVPLLEGSLTQFFCAPESMGVMKS